MLDLPELNDLLYLIRCAIARHPADPGRVRQMHLERLYLFSRFHSLAALTYTAVASAWAENPPTGLLPAGWKEARDTAMRNSLLFTAERKALEAFCEEKGIWYLPLKGILLQDLYPGLGLREMADHDILFDAAFQQEIHDWFVRRGYAVKEYKQGVHDTYHRAPVLNFEMHTALFEPSAYPEWAAWFAGALSRLRTEEGTHWGRRFAAEDFYLYLLAHMYKHFEMCGTGLRSLLDLFLFRRTYGKQLNQDILQRGLEELGLLAFDQQACTLADRIFGSEETLRPKQAEALACYLVSGTHGTVRNKVSKQLQELAGSGKTITGRVKVRYNLRRLFPDRAFMVRWCQHDAPFFSRHPRWMPLAYGYRVLYNLLHGRGKRLIREQRFLWKTL